MAIKNYAIFKQNLDLLIQNSNLDIGAIYFIMRDTLKDIELLYHGQINTEMIQEPAEEEQINEEAS